MANNTKPTLLVMASTYPRWRNDPEPAFVHELCRRLTSRFNVIALVPDAPKADPSGLLEGIEVIRYRYSLRRWQTLVNNGGIDTNLQRFPWKYLLVPGFLFGQYLAARSLLHNRKIDIIHAHWLLPQGLVAHYLSRSTKVPYVVTSHGGDLFGLRGRILTVLKQRVAVASSAMTVVSSAMQAEAARIGLTPPHISVLPMGVDLRERFIPNNQQPRSPDMLLFVGRLVPKKGLCHLLDALPTVIAKRPSVRLTIVGFGPEEAALKAQAEYLGIGKYINFQGATPQDELPDLYRRASLFVAPFIRDKSGNQEGLPVVLMEAIGCGCPAIVGNVDGIQDLLGDTVNKISVRPEDTQALAVAILHALESPQTTLAQAMTIREAVINNIDWEIIASSYADLIEQCLAKQ